jgi:hypothetical protein
MLIHYTLQKITMGHNKWTTIICIHLTFFWAKLVPYLRVATIGMKWDTLCLHKEVAVTCEKNMSDANEYKKLLEPPPI